MMATLRTLHKMCELCEITSSKRIYAADYKAEGVPFYRGKEISEKHRGNLDVSTELFIDRSKYEQIRAKFGAPKAGDLLLTSVGTLGSPYVVDEGEEFYFKDGNLTWFRNFKDLDSYYLYYWLLSPQGKAELKKSTIGSSQSAYTIVLLNKMEINLPGLPVQRKITSILSTYDDLIENNLQRIKILEEMAQGIYREWFVNFRFPGHEKVEMVDSPLGKIPDGWEVKRLDEIVIFQNRGAKAGGHLKERIYLPIDCLPRKSLAINEVKSWEEAQSSLHLFDEGDILFGAMRPYFHKVVVAPFKGVTRKTCFVFKAKEPEYYAFSVLTFFQESTVAFANSHSKGATIPYAVWPGAMDGMLVTVPTQELAARYEDIVQPTIAQIANIYFKNCILRKTRDLLLPKLISGELNVSDLDITIPEEAA